MKKIIITGFAGFVSYHFLEFLDSIGERWNVLGLDINTPEFNFKDYQHLKCNFHQIDLLVKSDVDNIIYQFQPEYILHLASFSSVAFSWKNPVASFTNNTNIFLNLIEQLRLMNISCRVLSIGSSEEYGKVDMASIPLKETSQLNAISPYAVARVSQEMLSKVYVDGFGMDIILTRSFNHIGPGQKDIFVVSSFAKKILQQKKSGTQTTLHTGDISIIRDFLDVRDVVKAYYLLLIKGRKGEIYNVCSGIGTSLKNIVEIIGDQLGILIKTETDSSLIRPNDNPVIIGDNSKLTSELGWTPKIMLKDSLRDIIEYWESQL